jgi:ribosomal protein S18 acetylase RimI-like enzyme
MSAIIRRAERRDSEALGNLGAMLMRTHFAFDPQRFLPPGESPEKGYGRFLTSFIDAEDDRVFVAEEEGEIVGYVYAGLEPLSWKELRGPAGFIHDVAVREESRQSGVAADLMQAALAWLREKRAPRCILWTATPNDAAQRLFRRLGFRETMREMTIEL